MSHVSGHVSNAAGKGQHGIFKLGGAFQQHQVSSHVVGVWLLMPITAGETPEGLNLEEASAGGPRAPNLYGVRPHVVGLKFTTTLQLFLFCN